MYLLPENVYERIPLPVPSVHWPVLLSLLLKPVSCVFIFIPFIMVEGRLCYVLIATIL